MQEKDIFMTENSKIDKCTFDENIGKERRVPKQYSKIIVQEQRLVC